MLRQLPKIHLHRRARSGNVFLFDAAQTIITNKYSYVDSPFANFQMVLVVKLLVFAQLRSTNHKFDVRLSCVLGEFQEVTISQYSFDCPGTLTSLLLLFGIAGRLNLVTP